MDKVVLIDTDSLYHFHITFLLLKFEVFINGFQNSQRWNFVYGKAL